MTTSTKSPNAAPGNISLKAENGQVLIQEQSKISSTIETGAGIGQNQDNPQIEIIGKSIDITRNSTVDARTNGRGNGANIFVTAVNGGAVNIRNSTLETAAHAQATGKGGDITITGESNISLTGAILNATTYGSTAGGNVFLNAANGQSVNLDVKRSKIYTEVFHAATGKGGDIVINVGAGSTSISDGSELNANTIGSGNAGSVFITANTLTIQGGSRSTASSGGSGSAGNVVVNATDSVILNGTNPFTDFRQFSQTDKTPTEGLFATATQQGGIAGNIFITTGNLMVKNGAAVAVSSPQGQAGNIEIRADKISLDNGALLATTGAKDSPGANIILLGRKTPDTELESLRSQIANNELGKKPLPGSSLEHLSLRNESLIEADANNNARGGNIAIKTQVLLALPPTGKYGSDITANAQGGSGGVVAIDSRPLGVYGIEFRTKLTPLNDITATSLSGPQGIVTIDLPDVDPSRGLVQLPENFGDSSKLITQSCPIGGQRAASRFVVTGRGGLPPNPSSALSSDTLVGDAPAIASSPENSPNATSSTDSTSVAPVEAQGVKIGPKGEFILTARPSTPSPHSPWQRFRGCDGE